MKMSNLRPGSKIIIAFIVSFLAIYGLINVITSQIAKRQHLIHQKETKIIQQEINNRFNLFLDVTLVIGQISSVYIHDQSRRDDNSYEKLVEKILEEKDYILGLNQLNADGKIINIYPTRANQGAKDKITQNYAELIKSFELGEKYWFSPPFSLFQGELGFAFYIPIIENGKLFGWIAAVISSQQFFERFKTMDFFSVYGLVIKDELTGTTYFSTGIVPENGMLEEVKSQIRGRSIIFQSWRIDGSKKFSLSFAWQFLTCLVFSLFIAFVMKIHLQKKKAYSRLENISDLLKLTSKEALTKLMDIQSEYLLIGSTGFIRTSVVEKDVHSITNLIEQIDLLQHIAESEQVEEESFEILPLLIVQIKDLQDVIEKKDIRINLNSESFNEVKVTGNKWLVSHTVIKNALSYCVLLSKPSSIIVISHTTSSSECSTIFHIEKVYEEEAYKPFKVERRLLVAQNVMDLLNGEISIQNDERGGIILKLTLNVPT